MPTNPLGRATFTLSDAVRLRAGVWGATRSGAVEVAQQIQAGQVFINGAGFKPDVPFGGYKRSGVGRENGRYGLEEFQQVKGLVYNDGGANAASRG